MIKIMTLKFKMIKRKCLTLMIMKTRDCLIKASIFMKRLDQKVLSKKLLKNECERIQEKVS
jgi:hypothetical protein